MFTLFFLYASGSKAWPRSLFNQPTLANCAIRWEKSSKPRLARFSITCTAERPSHGHFPVISSLCNAWHNMSAFLSIVLVTGPSQHWRSHGIPSSLNLTKQKSKIFVSKESSSHMFALFKWRCVVAGGWWVNHVCTTGIVLFVSTQVLLWIVRFDRVCVSGTTQVNTLNSKPFLWIHRPWPLALQTVYWNAWWSI